jgi:formylglycine-generating enzyme required for sulfatase activity
MLAYVGVMATALAAPSAGDTKKVTVKGVSFELAYAPAGTFVMGGPPNPYSYIQYPQHTVTLTRGFHIGTTEVTQALYEAVMGDNPSRNALRETDCATCPVEMVSWFEAVAFCNALSKLEGLEPAYTILEPTATVLDRMFGATSADVTWDTDVTQNKGASGYRLPTEAEWEYAARAGETHTYADSDRVDDVAWYYGNSDNQTHPVGQKAANAWGLHDMSGNVWEWTGDWYKKDYPTGSVTDPQGPTTGDDRVLRGGSFSNSADRTRAAYRGWNNPDGAFVYSGFRVVLPE